MLHRHRFFVLIAMTTVLAILPACAEEEKELAEMTTITLADDGNLRDGDGSIRSFTQISQEEAKNMIASDETLLIVDVRRQDEYEEGHIPGAILVPNEEIIDTMPEKLPDLDQTLLIYCRSGRRSKEAAQKLIEIGYVRVYEFGGIIDWTGETVVGKEP